MRTWLTPKQVTEKVPYGYHAVIRALEEGRLHGHQAVRRGRWQINEDCIDLWMQGRTGQEQICGCVALRIIQRKTA